MFVLRNSFYERAYLVCGDVVESLNLAILLDALEQHMRAKHIVLREDVGVAEAQIHMGMRSKVKDDVNIVLLQTPDHVSWYGYVAMKKAEVRF
jgi:hypothetical protein